MKVGVKLLVIQPWFTALGHPAQSLLNMACAIGKDERVDYLVSCSEGSGFCQDALERLQQWGEVENFAVTTPTGLVAHSRARLPAHPFF
jgi:hypothetical protein